MAVGKSSLVLRFVKGQFDEFQETTIGGEEGVQGSEVRGQHGCTVLIVLEASVCASLLCSDYLLRALSIDLLRVVKCSGTDWMSLNSPVSCLLSPVCPAAFLAQSVCLDDTTVKFEIWDTAGQERYHSLAPMYYRGAQAAIVVFDITKPVGEEADTCLHMDLINSEKTDVILMINNHFTQLII